MLIGIRVDASLQIGTGHIYRMLTLANKLLDSGHKVFFICRHLDGNLIDLVSQKFQVIELSKPVANEKKRRDTSYHCQHAPWLEVNYQQEIEESRIAIESILVMCGVNKLDWLIVDHYAVDIMWQKELSFLTKRIFQIDDLADRHHIADLLLDQNYYQTGEQRYAELLPNTAQRLCGPKYALLRDEFHNARNVMRSYSLRKKDQRVTLFFGGVDGQNETAKALKGLLMVESADFFDVIIGINNPNKVELEELCQLYKERVNLHIQVTNMMDFFEKSYLYVGAVGATTWERCAMALPGIVCSIAVNQTSLAQDLGKINGHYYIGRSSDVSAEDYRDAYQLIINNKNLLSTQSKLCASLVDGLGCQRVVELLERYDG